ncbi:MAG: DDE-type integrase/transposase/recombinase [Patescibacteria group bacterium]|nr:DDE-type integrase/transposase/recombinase [Patescibacteria group bacterium]
MIRNDEDWAVFWCSLLSPVLLGEIPEAQRERYFQQLSQEERRLPNGQRRCVSVRTFRRQWRRLKDGGVPGLYRRRRSDRGKARKKHADLLARAVVLKKEQPYRSDRVINRILKREFGRVVPRSTLYEHLRREGATRRRLGASTQKVRCRWTRDQPGALWLGDFEHGPLVMQRGEAIKTHLSAWIDCHSRYIVEARYYVRENLDILIDSLLRAWGNQGASRELYVDNAKIYHAKALRLACTQLNIKLLHRPPREPAPGGLIERFFRTCQTQFEAEVRASQILTLDELNRALAAWLEVAYHREVNRETGQAPHERFHREPRLIRRVDLGTVLTFFHRRVSRTVDEDHSDVRVDNMLFAVDPKLRGEKVIVEYDPFSSLEEVQLYSPTDVYLGRGKRYERERGSHSQPPPTTPTDPVTPHYLDALRAEHDAMHQQQRSQGIDYHSAQQRNIWSLTGFASALARLLGRRGGLSGLAAHEMEILAAFHARHDRVNERLLRQAFSQAASATIPEILFQLQSLLHERND